MTFIRSLTIRNFNLMKEDFKRTCVAPLYFFNHSPIYYSTVSMQTPSGVSQNFGYNVYNALMSIILLLNKFLVHNSIKSI